MFNIQCLLIHHIKVPLQRLTKQVIGHLQEEEPLVAIALLPQRPTKCLLVTYVV